MRRTLALAAAVSALALALAALLPASAFGGAAFLLLADLAARTALRPLELPIGVVTSLVGAVVFVWVFAASKRRRG